MTSSKYKEVNQNRTFYLHTIHAYYKLANTNALSMTAVK